MLQETACQPFEGEANASEAAMLQHDVAEILEALDERDDVDRNALAKLEWKYLRILEYSRRRPRVLLRALSEQPTLFVEMLSTVFRARLLAHAKDHDYQRVLTRYATGSVWSSHRCVRRARPRAARPRGGQRLAAPAAAALFSRKRRSSS